MTDKDIIKQAKERFSACLEYYSKEYERGKEDIQFRLGDQWDKEIREKRQREGRPCLTQNNTRTFYLQVVNDIRQSRPAIGVIPADDKADVKTAKILRGIIRNIENQSGADNVYDTAAGNSVGAGYGWIRVNTKYADDQGFDQELELLRVPDFQSVMIDPNSKEMDGSDAEFGFVYEDIARDNFKGQYPDADQVAFEDNKTQDKWCSENTIRVCEYFYKEYTKKTIYLLKDGSISETKSKDAIDDRVIRVPSIKWCKLTAKDVLEKTDWLGKYIPLIPVYGEEVWEGGRRKCYSLIHQAKDPQRRLNYWLTASTEIIALQPKNPYLGIRGQFATDAKKWATANNETYAYLEYDPVEMPDGTWATSAPQRQAPPMGSPAMFQEISFAVDGIKSTLGIYDASLGARGNETSGKAILARQAEGDNATFHFVDNLQSSIRHVGRVCIDMIPKIYTGPRIQRILGEDDSDQMVPINQAVVKTQDGYRPIKNNEIPTDFFDLNVGKYDVVATVGASYATKRIETATTLQAIIQAAPETFKIFGDVMIKNLDIAEADVLAERLKRLNPAMQDEQDPRDIQLQQAEQMIMGMQNNLQQLEGALKEKRAKDAGETSAEIAKIEADIRKTEAETAKIVAEIEQLRSTTGGVTPEALQQVVGTIAMLEEGYRDTSAAIDQILSNAESNQAPVPPVQ